MFVYMSANFGGLLSSHKVYCCPHLFIQMMFIIKMVTERMIRNKNSINLEMSLEIRLDVQASKGTY